MVDNITLKCYDKEVYHHLRYGTFVEKSNWISGEPYDRLLLNNGKSGIDRENLKIEFEKDSMTISGSIRKWYYGASSLDDLTKTDLEKAWRKVVKRLGISFPSRAFEDGGIHEAIAYYEDAVFFDILAEELARRDLGYPDSGMYNELNERMQKYLAEFDANGVENVTVDGID